MEEYEMKNKEKIHKKIQDICLDLIDPPHIEKIFIGGNIGLDFLSLFPQEIARIVGES
jgi:hypothetical protein